MINRYYHCFKVTGQEFPIDPSMVSVARENAYKYARAQSQTLRGTVRIYLHDGTFDEEVCKVSYIEPGACLGEWK